MMRSRERFKRFLEKRFSLRLHMFLILSGVFCAGLLSSKLLLEMHVLSMLIRYPLAVLCSYAAFFVFVKLWLVYLSSASGPGSSLVGSGRDGGGGSLPDISFDLPGSGSDGPSFGGGGATASFDGGPGISVEAFGSSPDSGGLAEGIADGAGDAVSGIFDGDDAWVLIVLGIVLALLCGAGVYLIYQAPVILSDAAFQAVLSTSLLRRMKKMSDPDWVGSVLRSTAVPFLVVLAASVAAAWAVHHAYPRAVSMSEVAHYLFHRYIG